MFQRYLIACNGFTRRIHFEVYNYISGQQASSKEKKRRVELANCIMHMDQYIWISNINLATHIFVPRPFASSRWSTIAICLVCHDNLCTYKQYRAKHLPNTILWISKCAIKIFQCWTHMLVYVFIVQIFWQKV